MERMENINYGNNNSLEETFFLSEIVKKPVKVNGKNIGRLVDFIIIDLGKVAEVTNLYVSRPFGDPALLVPWGKVKLLGIKEIILDIENIHQYENAVPERAVLLKDYIMDKKVLDVEGREVELVFDVKMALRNNKLYVIDVDLSKYGLLRRIGLKWLANFIYNLAEKIKKQTIAWDYVQPLPDSLDSFKGDIKLKVLKEQLSDIPPVDLADILEETSHKQRMAIFDKLDTNHASDTLEELDPKVQRDMIASLEKNRAAQLINEMTPGQAADILSVLPWSEVKAILKLLNEENALKIKEILEKHEENVINFIVKDYLKFSPDEIVLHARRLYSRMAKGKDVIMYLYILDEQEKLLGVVDIKELLLAEDNITLKDIMVTNVISLTSESTLKGASELFGRYGFRALPVINKNGKMLGVIPYRDVMNLKHLYLG